MLEPAFLTLIGYVGNKTGLKTQVEFKIDLDRNRNDKTGLARVRGVHIALYKREYPMSRHFSIIVRRVNKIRRATDYIL